LTKSKNKALVINPIGDQCIAIHKRLRKTQEMIICPLILNNNTGDANNASLNNQNQLIIKEAIKNHDFVLPMNASAMEAVLNSVESFSFGGIEMNSDCLKCSDKLYILEKAQSLNIPIPKTYTNPNGLYKFPVFYKEKSEKNGGGRGILYNGQALKRLDIEKLIFQEVIKGSSTYGYSFIAKDGKVLAQAMHKEILSYPFSGGAGIILSNFENEKLETYSKKIIKNLKYSGLGLVEYKFCKRRQDFVFMEINSKVWQSIEFSLRSNPLFSKLIFGIEENEDKPKKVFFTNRLVRLKGELFHAIPFILDILTAKWITEKQTEIRHLT
jgi:hypothetical protein